MKNKAITYHKQGNSCSASIMKAAIDKGLCSKELYNATTGFAGGVGSGCLCGAVTASIMVLSNVVGEHQAKQTAKTFMRNFKERYNATCCRVLSANKVGEDKRKHCNKIVEDCADILEEILK